MLVVRLLLKLCDECTEVRTVNTISDTNSSPKLMKLVLIDLANQSKHYSINKI